MVLAQRETTHEWKSNAHFKNWCHLSQEKPQNVENCVIPLERTVSYSTKCSEVRFLRVELVFQEGQICHDMKHNVICHHDMLIRLSPLGCDFLCLSVFPTGLREAFPRLYVFRPSYVIWSGLYEPAHYGRMCFFCCFFFSFPLSDRLTLCYVASFFSARIHFFMPHAWTYVKPSSPRCVTP